MPLMSGTREHQSNPNIQQMLERILAAGQFSRQEYFHQRQSKLNVPQMVERILAEGELSRQEYFHLAMSMLSDNHVTDEERRQINRVFDNIQTAEVKFID